MATFMEELLKAAKEAKAEERAGTSFKKVGSTAAKKTASQSATRAAMSVSSSHSSAMEAMEKSLKKVKKAINPPKSNWSNRTSTGAWKPSADELRKMSPKDIADLQIKSRRLKNQSVVATKFKSVGAKLNNSLQSAKAELGAYSDAVKKNISKGTGADAISSGAKKAKDAATKARRLEKHSSLSSQFNRMQRSAAKSLEKAASEVGLYNKYEKQWIGEATKKHIAEKAVIDKHLEKMYKPDADAIKKLSDKDFKNMSTKARRLQKQSSLSSQAGRLQRSATKTLESAASAVKDAVTPASKTAAGKARLEAFHKLPKTGISDAEYKIASRKLKKIELNFKKFERSLDPRHHLKKAESALKAAEAEVNSFKKSAEKTFKSLRKDVKGLGKSFDKAVGSAGKSGVSKSQLSPSFDSDFKSFQKRMSGMEKAQAKKHTEWVKAMNSKAAKSAAVDTRPLGMRGMGKQGGFVKVGPSPTAQKAAKSAMKALNVVKKVGSSGVAKALAKVGGPRGAMIIAGATALAVAGVGLYSYFSEGSDNSPSNEVKKAAMKTVSEAPLGSTTSETTSKAMGAAKDKARSIVKSRPETKTELSQALSEVRTSLSNMKKGADKLGEAIGAAVMSLSDEALDLLENGDTSLADKEMSKAKGITDAKSAMSVSMDEAVVGLSGSSEGAEKPSKPVSSAGAVGNKRSTVRRRSVRSVSKEPKPGTVRNGKIYVKGYSDTSGGKVKGHWRVLSKSKRAELRRKK